MQLGDLRLHVGVPNIRMRTGRGENVPLSARVYLDAGVAVGRTCDCDDFDRQWGVTVGNENALTDRPARRILIGRSVLREAGAFDMEDQRGGRALQGKVRVHDAEELAILSDEKRRLLEGESGDCGFAAGDRLLVGKGRRIGDGDEGGENDGDNSGDVERQQAPRRPGWTGAGFRMMLKKGGFHSRSDRKLWRRHIRAGGDVLIPAAVFPRRELKQRARSSRRTLHCLPVKLYESIAGFERQGQGCLRSGGSG